jgi:hypothetical protein
MINLADDGTKYFLDSENVAVITADEYYENVASLQKVATF